MITHSTSKSYKRQTFITAYHLVNKASFSHFFRTCNIRENGIKPGASAASNSHPNFVCPVCFLNQLWWLWGCVCVWVTRLSLRDLVLAWITPRSHSARFLRWLACLWPYTSMATAPSAKNSPNSSDTGTDSSWKVSQIKQDCFLILTIISIVVLLSLHGCLLAKLVLVIG